MATPDNVYQWPTTPNGAAFFDVIVTDLSDSDAHTVEVRTDFSGCMVFHVVMSDGTSTDVITLTIGTSYEVGDDLTALAYSDISQEVFSAASISNVGGAVDSIYKCDDDSSVGYAVQFTYQRTSGTADDGDITIRGKVMPFR